jgi:hypothetical protein
MYTPVQFAKRVNVSVKRSQKWDRLGIMLAKRTITNRRYYIDEDLTAALRMPRVPSVRRTVATAMSQVRPITGFSHSKKNPWTVLTTATHCNR